MLGSTRFPGRLPFLMLAFAAGCGGGGGETGITGPGQDGPADDPNESTDGDFVLQFVNGPDIAVARGTETELEVLYIDAKGDVVVDGDVGFDIEGASSGATLASRTARTDSLGEGRVTLRAGSQEGSFEVVASAEYAEPIRFRVDVVPTGAGDLRIALSYAGTRRLRGADVILYAARGCEGLLPESPPPGDLLQSVPTVHDDATFEGLDSGSQWAVLATAVNENGHVAAWGCWPEARVVDGQETVVELLLQDVTMSSDGRWELESHYDLGDALPEGVDDAFDALAEMTDDPNDPATWVLDQLRAEIDDDGLRFAFDAARILWGLDAALNAEIQLIAPGFAADGLQASGDLGRALADVQIDSDLRLGTADEFGVIAGEHQLVDLVLTLDGVASRYSMTNDVHVQDAVARGVHVTIADDQSVHVDAHSFRVGLGTLVLFALNEMVLPGFDGSPHSISDLFADLIDCGWIGGWLSSMVGIGSTNLWTGLCDVAISTASVTSENEILDLNDDYDTMSLTGTARIDDANGDLDVDQMTGGRWTATWTGGTGAREFAGTFEGTRY